MLYARSPSPAEGRELRRLVDTATPTLARYARMVLLSAEGHSVPAIATAVGSCRRAVRACVHRFAAGGPTALPGKRPGPRPRRSAPEPAPPPEDPDPAARGLPVAPLSIPDIHRLWADRIRRTQAPVHNAAFRSLNRRFKRATATIHSFLRRGLPPPAFELAYFAPRY